jgi:hypothetical protein
MDNGQQTNSCIALAVLKLIYTVAEVINVHQNTAVLRKGIKLP